MDRTAVFVDAGYLFAAGSKLISNEKLPRGELNLNYDAVLKLLTGLVADITELPLLRVYWYDGTSTGPTPQQLALAYRPSVKLRLGFVNQQGQQKGVDSLIVTDLINLARNRAMADVLLLTGDEDIRVGVQQAQEFGVRVHLLGVAPARENQSGFLVQEADSVRELTLAEVETFLSRVAPPATALQLAVQPASPSSPASTDAGQDGIKATARHIAGRLSLEEVTAVIRESEGGAVPSQLDRQLLLTGSQALGGTSLNPAQKRQLRSAFLDECRKRLQ
ncbi:MAG: NYN domain-containing protein [Planctomycetes bacterium]|nr:NYN domain-containing protein [Planctomycetota bacterium]